MMLDLKNECSVSEDQSNEVKRCTDCLTTTTPLWRGGPSGPKTLCNACGIKYHKRRRALLGIDKGKAEKNKKKCSKNGNNGVPLKIKVMASGIRQRENLEIKQAAMLLMALSYSSVYA